MSDIVRSDLKNVNGAELIQHLIDKGFTRVQTRLEEDGMRIIVENVEPSAIQAALTDYTPVASPDEWIFPLPEEIRLHLSHLKDYLQADPTTITNAQTVHVVRDLIRAVRFMNNRLVDG